MQGWSKHIGESVSRVEHLVFADSSMNFAGKRRASQFVESWVPELECLH